MPWPPAYLAFFLEVYIRPKIARIGITVKAMVATIDISI
jgi:hypothetical protein